MSLQDIINLEEKTTQAYDPHAGSKAFADALIKTTIGEINRRRTEKETLRKEGLEKETISQKQGFEMAKQQKYIEAGYGKQLLESETGLKKQSMSDVADITIAGMKDVKVNKPTKDQLAVYNNTIENLYKGMYRVKNAEGKLETKHIRFREEAIAYGQKAKNMGVFGLPADTSNKLAELYPTHAEWEARVNKSDKEDFKGLRTRNSAEKKVNEEVAKEVMLKASNILAEHQKRTMSFKETPYVVVIDNAGIRNKLPRTQLQQALSQGYTLEGDYIE